jgi:hypothetical protein
MSNLLLLAILALLYECSCLLLPNTVKNNRITSIRGLPRETGLIVGSTGLMVVLINRLQNGLELVGESQSRSDILSIIVCSAVLLDWLSESEVKTVQRDQVSLVGYAHKTINLSQSLSDNQIPTFEWLIKSFLKIGFVTSVHAVVNEKLVAQGGVVGMNSRTDDLLVLDNKPILKEAIEKSKQIYLPDLQVLYSQYL